MITYKTVPWLPPDMILSETCLTDRALDKDYPINPSTYVMLSALDGKTNVRDLLAFIQTQFTDADPDVLENDFLSLLHSMKQNQMIHVSSGLKESLQRLWLSLKIPGGKAYMYKRHSLVSLSFWRILFFISGVVLKKMGPVLSAFLLFSFFPLMAMGEWEWMVFPAALMLFFLSLIVSIALHESAHLFMLRFRYRNAYIGYVKEEWLTFKVVRPSLDEDLSIIVAGPLVTAVTGNVGMWAALFIVDPFWHLTLHLCTGVFLIHLIYLFPFAGDGKQFMKVLKSQKKGVSG